MKAKHTFLYAICILANSLAGKTPTTQPGVSQIISFKENKGQVFDQNYGPRPDVLFTGSYNGLSYHFTRSGVSYQLIKASQVQNNLTDSKDNKAIPSTTLEIYRVDVKWIGVNKSAEITKGKINASTENYYLQHCPKGALGVNSFESINYSGIYKGIDLMWHGKNGELEYDFNVEPGADPSQIKFELEGASGLSIGTDGSLLIKTPLGVITEKKPIAYQNGIEIPVSWKLDGNKLSFDISEYDRTKPLLIDPVLRVWGTYVGDASFDRNYGCATDASSNVYVVGTTQSTANIATAGAYQSTVNVGGDAFINKFDLNGVRLWGTYIGGNLADQAMSCVVDNVSNSLYLTGYTFSSTFPVTAAAHQTVSGGNNDGFLAKFSSTGVLQWSTYYGGSGNDYSRSCCLDNLGNVYIGGAAASSTGTIIATPGSHQPTYGTGTYDAFLAKFSSAGVRQWATYYGGTAIDDGNSCAADISGNVYLSGYSTSTGTAVATVGSHQSVAGGGNDAFLVKFNSAGVRQWGTLYGSTGNETSYACATFSNNAVYIGGIGAFSTGTVIATPGTHQPNFAGGSNDAFLVKFDGAGVRQWGTWYGGPAGLESIYSACTSTNGDVIVSGYTSGTGFSTAGSHQAAAGGSDDAFIAKFNASGIRQWGSYYGGTLIEYGWACCTSANANIYMCGETGSSANIASVGAFKTTLFGTGGDGFLVRFADCPSLTLTIAGTNTLCVGQSATLTATGSGFTTYTWSTASNASSIVVTPTANATYTLTAGTATTGCVYSDVHTVSVNIQPTVVVNPPSTVICSGNSVTLTASGANTYSWSTGPTTASIVVTPTAMTQPIVTGNSNGCTHSVMVNVGVSTTPTVMISGTSTQTYCTNSSLTLTAFGASTYTWSNGPTTFSNVVSPTVVTVYTVTGSLGQCIDDYTVTVSPVTQPTVNLTTTSQSVCTGGSATLIASGAASYSWNTSATTSSIVVSPATPTSYTVTGNNGACAHTKTINIGISTTITVLASSNPSALCAGSSATITANGASTYTWNTSSNAFSIVVSPTSSTTYTVSGNSGSCFGTASVNLNVNPLPIISANANPTLICVSGTAALTASGANSYTWMPGNLIGAAVTDTVSSTTIYTVVGQDAQACNNTQTVQITVDPCTGVGENVDPNVLVKVIPNPSNGNLIISGLNKGYYSLVNSLGQTISNFTLLEEKQDLHLKNLAPGVYYFTGHGSTQKIVVMK